MTTKNKIFENFRKDLIAESPLVFPRTHRSASELSLIKKDSTRIFTKSIIPRFRKVLLEQLVIRTNLFTKNGNIVFGDAEDLLKTWLSKPENWAAEIISKLENQLENIAVLARHDVGDDDKGVERGFNLLSKTLKVNPESKAMRGNSESMKNRARRIKKNRIGK